MINLKKQIEQAWDNRELLKETATIYAIEKVIEHLDKGELRIAEKDAIGWQVNDWLKKAVLLYFPIKQMETMEAGPMEFYDKIPLKKNYKDKGVRVVPHAVARHGAYLAKGVILMPSYVNIGA